MCFNIIVCDARSLNIMIGYSGVISLKVFHTHCNATAFNTKHDNRIGIIFSTLNKSAATHAQEKKCENGKPLTQNVISFRHLYGWSRISHIIYCHCHIQQSRSQLLSSICFTFACSTFSTHHKFNANKFQNKAMVFFFICAASNFFLFFFFCAANFYKCSIIYLLPIATWPIVFSRKNVSFSTTLQSQ